MSPVPLGAARSARVAPWLALAGAVAWGCWTWRAELDPVPYLDDSSVHEQMVRFATTRLQAGHLPLTSWFPYLGLGSPQFLHYQSLPAMLTGALGLATGADAAFRITLYLLLALWPVPVFFAARLFGLGRGAAALSAACAPFLVSAAGVGYEPKAYVWIGYGVWAQLWAAWTLPLAWAFSWRAMTSRRAVLPAAVLVALTMAFHFETGYLALIPLVFLPFLVPGSWWPRLRRAAVVAAGGLLVAAWAVVPLLAQGRFAATNEILANGPLENGYGAKQVTAWLVGGRLLDDYRLPVVTVLAAVGLVACVWRWRTQAAGRALVTLGAMSLLLSFGRTTFGSLTVLLPGSKDIFMRRFMMGVQLSALLLAGVGGVAVVGALRAVMTRRRPAMAARLARPGLRPVLIGTAFVVTVAALAPAWTQLDTFAADNAQDIGVQRGADGTQGAEVNRLVAFVQGHGGGRVYAGMPSNWGADFSVGAVPVFKYLEDRDVDEVGYTLRTASLMTDPEYFFDEADPGDFALFAVRYMILPDGHPPPVPARLVMRAGPYLLWVLPGRGYVRVVDTVGVLSADRSDVGRMSVPYLRSVLPGNGYYLTVAYGGAAPAGLSTSDVRALSGPAGAVRTEVDDLPDGSVSATVVARRSADVVLSASFDPGWTALVDGRRAHVVMLAPALPAVEVGPGTHVVSFRYGGFGLYPELFALSAVAVLALVLYSVRAGEGADRDRRRNRARRRRRSGATRTPDDAVVA
ncbi:MAG: hypothetical protein ABSG81_13715 [Acidimicrobiales bacterium]